jgi:hypothetical protein
MNVCLAPIFLPGDIPSALGYSSVIKLSSAAGEIAATITDRVKQQPSQGKAGGGEEDCDLRDAIGV